MPNLIDRLLGRGVSASNGNGAKSVGGTSGVVMDPRIQWFSPDGTRTIYALNGSGSSEAERVSAQTAYAAAAYAYVAMRYRASRLAEPPLMVVKEDQKTGDEEWLPKHALAALLESPSPDYDMGELLFRTSVYVDRDGQALWLKDANSLGRPGRLTPFAGTEFTIESTRELMRGKFLLHTARGDKTVTPDDVVYFHEPNPADWLRGLSRLDVMLGWLNLGQVARATVRDLLANAAWPSIVVTPDKEWNPTDPEFKEFQAKLDSWNTPGERGRPLVMLGGGTIEVVSARIRDLIPEDILNRVESICSSVFGIPAIVLQYHVGMENSPWSQMAEARRMCYEDTIEPMWREYEKRLTRQLLRPLDPDVTHLVRFDTTRIRALQVDQQKQATTANLWGRQASLNERRGLMGLEPSDDPKANEIPELKQPDPLAMLGMTEDDDDDAPPAKAAEKWRSLWAALRADQAARAVFDWQVNTQRQLDRDRAEIVNLARQHLEGGKAEDPPVTPEQRRRFFAAVQLYVEKSKGEWEKVVTPLIRKNADRAMSALASDLGFSFELLRPELVKYVERESAFLVKSITDTTRDRVRDALARGIEDGLGARAIAKEMENLPAFNRDRALLVARTEATRVTNGAPTDALKARQAEGGVRFTKTWSTALDDRVRDEHAEMEGETVPVDQAFSNGLQAPGEPNCRCTLTYAEVEA